MKQIHWCFLLLATVFFSTSLTAQKRSVPGYYLTLQGDTVAGAFPDYANWNRNPSKINFKPTATGQTIVLTPANCRQLIISGYDQYVAFSGERLLNVIDEAEVMQRSLLTMKDDTIEHFTVFLRLVQPTPLASLFLYQDKIRRNFFLQLHGHSMEELRFKRYLNEGRIVEVPTFRDQLADVFKDQIQTRKRSGALASLLYLEEDLSRFLLSLFPALEKKTANKTAGKGWVLSIGAAFNQITTTFESNNDYIAKDYEASIAPVFSVGYYWPLNRNFGRFFLNPQIRFFRYQNSGEFVHSDYLRTTTYRADLIGMLTVNAGVNIVNRDPARLFLSGGMGTFLQLNAKQIRHSSSANDPAYTSLFETELPTMKVCMNGSVGVILNQNYFLSLNYLLPLDIADFVYYAPRLTSMQLQFGYRLH